MKKLLTVLLMIGLAFWTYGAVDTGVKASAFDDPPCCEDCKDCKGDCKDCKDCKGDCKDCKDCKDCRGDCKDCKDCKDCRGDCKDCKDCKGDCKQTCGTKECQNTFAWMTDYILNTGGVFNKLELTQEQKTKLKNLMFVNSMKVMNSATELYKCSGECPVTAIQCKKYKNCDASSLCVSGEVAMMFDKPLHKKIKSILTEQQYKKYKAAMTVLSDYTKKARDIMKTGEKGYKKLADLYVAYRKKLDKALPAPVKKTAKADSEV